MNINILKGGRPTSLLPLTCSFDLEDIPVCGIALGERLKQRFAGVINSQTLSVSPTLYMSAALFNQVAGTTEPSRIITSGGQVLGWLNDTESQPEKAADIAVDAESIVVKYPWDVLAVCERIVGELKTNDIRGEIRENVVIDGMVEIGEGSVLLPGVYIEGNAIIGANVKLGPNCYLRGNTYIGDNCHVGQAVEVKNSMLMNKVSAGHLSYIGDSIVGPKTNFGAGTIISNFRHDGKNHRSMVDGELVDTGRRKFGAIIGANVHTGIHTSIYPGRKIWADMSTRPGDIVQKDLLPENQ